MVDSGGGQGEEEEEEGGMNKAGVGRRGIFRLAAAAGGGRGNGNNGRAGYETTHTRMMRAAAAAAVAATAVAGAAATNGDGVEGVTAMASTLPRSARTLYTYGCVVADYKMTTMVSSMSSTYKMYVRRSRDGDASAEAAAMEEDEAEHERRMHEAHVRCARRVLDMCQRNGGVYAKAGQIVASVRAVPQEYRSALSALECRARARPVHRRRVDAVLRREKMQRRKGQGGSNANDTKKKEEEEEQDFFCEEVPIAAGSIAQVHRATIDAPDRGCGGGAIGSVIIGEDGNETEASRMVAVKVQYPGLRKTMASDIFLVRSLMKIAYYAFDSDWRWLVDDLHARLKQELDFRLEASNATTLAKNFSSDDGVVVPRVDDQRSGRCVLVTDWIDNTVKISDTERMLEMGLQPREVGVALVRAFAQMTFIDGFVHNDPHPGNILVKSVPVEDTTRSRDDDDDDDNDNDNNNNGVALDERGDYAGPAFRYKPQIVLLDAGACLSLDDTLRKSFCGFWTGAMTGNQQQMTVACEGMGLSAEYAHKLAFFVTKVPPPPRPQKETSAPVSSSSSITASARPSASSLASDSSTDHHYLPQSLHRINGETRKERRKRIARRLDEVSSVLDSLPRNLVQLLRVTGLIRQTARELGVSNYEFLTMYAYYAVYGSYLNHSPSTTGDEESIFGWLNSSVNFYSTLSTVWLTGTTIWLHDCLFGPRVEQTPTRESHHRHRDDRASETPAELRATAA